MAIRVAVLLALLLPAQASAAVTIGSSLPPWTGDTIECVDAGGCTFVPRTIAGNAVVVPFDGVIVRWSARMPTGADTGPIRLKDVQLTPGGATASGATWLLNPPAVAGATVESTGRMSVRAGDLIGVQLDNGDEIGISPHATFDSTSWFFAPPLTSERPPDSIDTDDFEALFNATIEPDPDHDGYGDETQDNCPQLTEEHLRTCTGRPTMFLSSGFAGIGVVEVGKQMEIRATVGAPTSLAPNVVLRLTLPSALKPVEIRGTEFCTTAANEVTCPLGTMRPGGPKSVVVEALALRPAVAQIRADLTTAVPGSTPTTATDDIRVRTPKACGLAIQAEDGDGRGTSGGDRITGTRGDDNLSGRSGADCLSGRGGDDLLSGGGGNDRVDGGRGDDLMRGAGGNDRLTGGSGADRFEGGSGNDFIDAADGRRDIVRCGDGRDRARVDRLDAVAGCERVRLVRR